MNIRVSTVIYLFYFRNHYLSHITLIPTQSNAVYLALTIHIWRFPIHPNFPSSSSLPIILIRRLFMAGNTNAFKPAKDGGVILLKLFDLGRQCRSWVDFMFGWFGGLAMSPCAQVPRPFAWHCSLLVTPKAKQEPGEDAQPSGFLPLCRYRDTFRVLHLPLLFRDQGG